MKKIFFLFSIVIFPIYLQAQTFTNIDYISPFNDGLAAVKKGDQWGFINTEGTLVIDFRKDLVSTNIDRANYPVFIKDRCLISEEKEGISYFGYIDSSGKTVVEPIFLNATNFNMDYAIVLALVKDEVGRNDLLGIDIFKYKYFEVLINNKGEITKYLLPDNAVVITLDKGKLVKPPEITSKLLSNKVFSTQLKNKKLEVRKI